MPRPNFPRIPLAAVAAGLVLGLVLLLGGCGSSQVPGDPVWTQATVHLSGVSCGTPEAGMGVIIDDNVILTSGHVVLAMQRVDVLLPSGQTIEGEVLHIDRAQDVAIVRAPVSASFEPNIRDAAVDEVGVVALLDKEAVAQDQPFRVTGRITARTENVGRSEMIQRPSLELAADIKRGDSGAALWVGEPDDANIVGVIWAVSTTDDRVFAVQGDEVATVCSERRE